MFLKPEVMVLENAQKFDLIKTNFLKEFDLNFPLPDGQLSFEMLKKFIHSLMNLQKIHPLLIIKISDKNFH